MAVATNEQIVAFIELLAPLAIAECNRLASEGKGFVLPSVCIAQSAHETGWGTADIMVKANAFFGIKAGGSWTGKIYTADTWEVVNGESYNTSANFRAYDNLADSVRDYYDLMGASRYANALSTLDNRLTPLETVTAIWSAGYATDPPYVELVMDLLNGRDLDQYDSKVDGISTGTGGSSGGDYGYIAPPESTETTNIKFVFEKIE